MGLGKRNNFCYDSTEEPPNKKQCIDLENDIIPLLSDDDSDDINDLLNNNQNHIKEENKNILPPNWIIKKTARGNICYTNIETGEFSTVHPSYNNNDNDNDSDNDNKSIISIIDNSLSSNQDSLSNSPNSVKTGLMGEITSYDTPDSILDIDKKLIKDSENIINDVASKLKIDLFSHQRDAIIWMREHENHPEYNGGILADDMGCGKTISTISLLISNPNLHSKYQHTLIVAPFSLLLQWKQELSERTSKKVLRKIYIHHGTNRTYDDKDFEKYDIVITTYGTLGSEYYCEYEGSKLVYEERGPLLRFKWYRVILDEAHAIKNRTTKSSRAAFALKTSKRWCLTGTPIQNNLSELFTLFAFLRFMPYGNYSYWVSNFIIPLKNEPEQTMKRLREVVQQILLRRIKASVLSEELKLPPKYQDTLSLDFKYDKEKDFYEYLEKLSQTQFNNIAQNDNDVRENYHSILQLISRLRQACCHPLLAKPSQNEMDDFIDDGENLKSMEFDEYVKKRILEDECSICTELAAPEACVTTKCGHRYCKICILAWLERKNTCPNCNQDITENTLLPLTELLNPEKEDNIIPMQDSTKLRTLMEELNLMITTTEDKCIIASQWTSFLKYIQDALKQEGIEYLQIDGTQSMILRRSTIDVFEEGNCRVLLVSMKAAGLGLNIITANRVFLMDLWWNLSVENQVIDRCHRIGQTKEVFIKKFTIKDTIEERILDLQEKKQLVADCALTDGGHIGTQRLDYETLKHLFGMNRSFKDPNCDSP